MRRDNKITWACVLRLTQNGPQTCDKQAKFGLTLNPILAPWGTYGLGQYGLSLS